MFPENLLQTGPGHRSQKMPLGLQLSLETQLFHVPFGRTIQWGGGGGRPWQHPGCTSTVCLSSLSFSTGDSACPGPSSRSRIKPRSLPVRLFLAADVKMCGTPWRQFTVIGGLQRLANIQRRIQGRTGSVIFSWLTWSAARKISSFAWFASSAASRASLFPPPPPPHQGVRQFSLPPQASG